MEETWESWAKLIRSTVLSSKRLLTPHEIYQDIKNMDGSEIPYNKMNYRSLEEMFKNISGLKVFRLNGQTVVQAMADQKTAHIQRMIRRQKEPKKKRTISYQTVPKTQFINKQSTKSQLPMNYRNVINVPVNRCNQNISHNLSSQISFTPKITSTPTSVIQKSVQIPQQQKQQHQHHQQQPSSSKNNIQFAPKPNLQELTPSARLLSALLNPMHDSVPDSAPQQWPSAESQRHTVEIVDPRIMLNIYCEHCQLPKPVYSDLKSVHENVYCSVKVACKRYSSYPQEARSKDEAEKFAAEVALKEISKDYNIRSTIVTSDQALVAKRIVDMVNAHPSGLFEFCAVESYLTQYNESLPSNWLKLVEHLINVDVTANNFIILSPANYNINIKAHAVTLVEPENLKLNVEEFWLQVYNVDNTTSIWGLIIDENHSDKIVELAQEMKVYYDKEKSNASLVVPGKHYAIFDSEWHRVRCIKLDKEIETATVFFIDRGDKDVVLISRLRVLHSEFCKLPAQALCLSLAGLEIFQDCEKVQILLKHSGLVDKSVYARIIRNNERFEMVTNTDVLSAELFFEQGGEEINFNRSIRSEILSTIVNPIAFLRPEELPREVYISYVDESAIFIQLKSQGLKLLTSLINNLAREHLKPILNFDVLKMYIANIQDEWQRVRIKKIENEDMAQVECIDVGNTVSVTRNNLVLLEELSEILTEYPKQAVQVHLHKISPLMFNEEMVNRLRDLAPKTDVFYVKVVGSFQNVPTVEFYKKTDNDYLASLNDTLALESEINISGDNNSNCQLHRSDQSAIATFSDFPLKAPVVPPIGSLLEVYVTMAAHPDNFKIQILTSLNELETLEEELSRYCESYSDSALTFSSIKVGNMYAAKCDKSNRWYRAYVSSIENKTYVIYFCDYGVYKAVPINKLRPLKNQFYDLPYQAITAALYGIKPKLNGIWTENDSYRLNELIVNKIFYAVIKSCEQESTGEMILGLDLIETSTPNNIFIREVLINENIADELT